MHREPKGESNGEPNGEPNVMLKGMLDGMDRKANCGVEVHLGIMAMR